MRNVSNAPIKTFTVGFHEPEFDESEPARAVARHLGTDHTALYIGASDALELVPTLTEVYDEPFADPSQLPTLLISKLARRSVTVALSGDGGDEFFGGYNRYLATDRLWRRIQKIPFFIRAYIGRRIQSIRPDMLGAFASTFEARVLGRKQLTPNAGSKLLKIGGLMQQPSLVMAYRHLISYWDDPRSVTGVEEPVSHIGATSTALLADGSFIDQAMYWDQVSYLLDDNLTKIDRASMAYGLETRLPLLDHSLVGLAWRIPSGLRVHQGQTKWPLRQILYRYVPQELLDRPKMGFSVPIGSWLRGPLRDWAEDLFRAETANPKLDFDMRIVWSLWSRHLTRASNADLRLWSVLMLIDWAHRSTRWHGRGN
jgi:asparagine synthase (glutamine-hydrolysing)